MSTSKNDKISALSFSEKRILENRWFDSRAVKHEASCFWVLADYDHVTNATTSPTFKSIIGDEYEWCLEHYPGNASQPRLGEFCLILCPSKVDTCNKMFLRCKLKFMQNGKKEVLQSELLSIRLFPEMRSEDFKCYTFSENRKYSLFVNGTALFVSCEVEFSTDDCEYVSNELNSCGLQFTISEEIVNFMKNKMYTDITFSVDDKEFQAHKLILAARSPVFAAMFNHTMKENTTNRVEIKDLEPEVVEEMLHFIYTGKCENLDQYARGLFIAADKYDLKELKVMCEQALLRETNCENAATTLLWADSHRADRLKLNVIEFIMAEAVEVTSSTTWNNLFVENSKLAREVYDAMAHRLTDILKKEN